MQKEDNYLSLIENQKELEKKITSTVLSMNVNKNNEGENHFYLVDIFTLNEFLIVSKITKEMAMFVGTLQEDNEIVFNINLRYYQCFLKCLKNALRLLQSIISLI